MLNRPCQCDKAKCPFCIHWRNGTLRDNTATAKVATKRGTFVAKVEPPPETYPCRYRGEATGEKVGCVTCDNITLEVLSCAKFGKCTESKAPKKKGVKCCKFCSSRSEYSVEELIQLPAKIAKPQGWSSRLEVIAAHHAAADKFIESIPPYPEGKFAGRGIVIATGTKYWASTYVTVRMLRHFGCALPVQVWFLGESGERDERYEKLLKPFDVEFIDIDTHPARKHRRGVAGFQTKLFAAINSPFEEVLSLDPDSYPCRDPIIVFEDDEGYWNTGGVFWPDLPHTNAWTNFAFFGAKPRGECGLETGQYVYDKRKAWDVINLAEWYDDHADWCYGVAGPNGGGDYGDKGPHRAAWAKMERDYTIYSSVAQWEQAAFVQIGPDGIPLFIHRCRAKFMAEGKLKFSTTPQNGENIRLGLPGEDEAFRFLDELKLSLRKM